MPTAVSAAIDTPPKEVATLNFFAPLRACDMDKETTNIKASLHETTVPAKTGQPPPIVPASAVNLIQLQKQLKGVVSENLRVP
jgi:hypothetical protein